MSKDCTYYRLDGRSSTLVLLAQDRGVAEILYWGEALAADASLDTLQALGSRPLGFSSFDREAPLSLLPEESRGCAGSVGLAAHRQGLGYAHRFVSTHAQVAPDSLKFFLADEAAGLALEISLLWFPDTDTLRLQTQLQNQGKLPLSLDHLACPTLALPSSLREVLTLHGRWGGEFQRERQSLPASAALLIEQRAGRSGPEHFPGLVIGETGFNETSGEVWGVHLAWSGNYRLRLETLIDGRTYLQASELLLPGEVLLAPGERYETPQLYATRAVGLTQMSQQFHRFVRRSILPAWTRTPRPVLANSWEAVYFDHQLPRLKEIVAAAAASGAERFVLDDGWFMARRHDRAGLGDWRVDPSVYPEGLAPLIAFVQQKGLSFGLWVEPEMLSPDSELFRSHPDWVLQAAGYPLITARQQLVLNLAHPAAFAHIKDALSALLRSYPIAFLKWDMNRRLALPADAKGQAAAHRQMQAVYRLFDELLRDFPQLEIESCASGGGRVDFEILRRTGRVWTSDNIDPISRLSIQRGFSLFFPPEIMGAHIGAEKAHLTGRRTDPHFRAIVALQGQLGFEMDLSQAHPDELAIYRSYVELYKKHRSWIQDARVYRRETRDRALSVSAYVGESTSLWWITTQGPLETSIPPTIQLCGLDPAKSYCVQLENKNRDALSRFMQKPNQLLAAKEGLIASGELLMKHGISLPVLAPDTALLLSCTAR